MFISKQSKYLHSRACECHGISRRDFLYQMGAGLGTVALSALLQEDLARAGVLAPKAPHHPAKAKACIFLLMEGGASHIDTFDPKPKLQSLHMTEFVRQDKFASAMESATLSPVLSSFEEWAKRVSKSATTFNTWRAASTTCASIVAR